jgi:hypothetical protein
MRLYYKIYKTLQEEERKAKQQLGDESPYIHNPFFPPRDYTVTITLRTLKPKQQ